MIKSASRGVAPALKTCAVRKNMRSEVYRQPVADLALPPDSPAAMK
ncbi:MAG: hypothetical protein Q8M19_00810 [Reyranella sp.]|nr:hypothetical protein [Reyranella sp.]